MSTYKIINDREELQRFVDFLPELNEGEVYYFCLFARKKYAPNSILKSDKCSLKRFVTTSKSRIIDKIEKLEIKLGNYKMDDLEVPNESLVLYMMPNPRNTLKVLTEFNKFVLDQLVIKGNKNINPVQELMSFYQKEKSYTFVQDFEFDFEKTEDNFEQIKGFLSYFLNAEAYTIVESRGGFHVLVQPSKIEENKRRMYHQKIQSFVWYDKQSKTDSLLPVPGCIQGGFVPFIHKHS